MTAPKQLTVNEAAEYLRCGVWTIKRLCGAGALVASKVAGRWLISEDSVAAYLGATSNSPRRRRKRAS